MPTCLRAGRLWHHARPVGHVAPPGPHPARYCRANIRVPDEDLRRPGHAEPARLDVIDSLAHTSFPHPEPGRTAAVQDSLPPLLCCVIRAVVALASPSRSGLQQSAPALGQTWDRCHAATLGQSPSLCGDVAQIFKPTPMVRPAGHYISRQPLLLADLSKLCFSLHLIPVLSEFVLENILCLPLTFRSGAHSLVNCPTARARQTCDPSTLCSNGAP